MPAIPERAMEGCVVLPGFVLADCADLAVPADVMHHVVRVESSYNPYAIGVVGARLARQPRDLHEAVATARMLEQRGYDFSVGLAQVNRRNLAPQRLDSYERAFAACPNVQAGARILADCHRRAGGDWGRAFSCYYSGNFSTGFQHGYVRKVFASMGVTTAESNPQAVAIDLVDERRSVVAARSQRQRADTQSASDSTPSLIARRAVAPPVPPQSPFRSEPPKAVAPTAESDAASPPPVYPRHPAPRDAAFVF